MHMIAYNYMRYLMIESAQKAGAPVVPERLDRNKPSAVKRRPKPYQLLTAPRHEMKVTKHRGRYHAKATKFSGIRI